MSASTDLLYAAARAAGYQVARVSDDGESLLLVGVQEHWNPLTDDGDALRLAVRLGLFVDAYAPATTVGNVICPTSLASKTRMEDHNGDPYAATRRAIVRAAADIDRALQPNHESPANSKPGCTGGGG